MLPCLPLPCVSAFFPRVLLVLRSFRITHSPLTEAILSLKGDRELRRPKNKGPAGVCAAYMKLAVSQITPRGPIHMHKIIDPLHKSGSHSVDQDQQLRHCGPLGQQIR